MKRSVYRSGVMALVLMGFTGLCAAPASAQSVMQQCGQQYQAAKAANTLNGQTWNQYRTECSARLKATPAAQTGTAPAATPAAAPAPASTPANPLKPAAAPAPTPAPASSTAASPMAPAPASAAAPTVDKNGKPLSAAQSAHLARQRQCGAEWRANKVTLVAQTPGLTWPKYYSTCNTRLKAAGQ